MDQNRLQSNERRWDFDGAGRDAYGDPMSGASRGPLSAEDLEFITRRLEAFKVAEACGSDTDERTTTQILAGAESAEKYLEDVRRKYWNSVAKMQERFWGLQGDSRQLVAFKTSELSNLQEYRCQLFHLVEAVKQQLSRKESAAVLGIQRNQHYQDLLASNAEYLPRLEDQYSNIKSLADIKQDELKKLEEAEDVARDSHARHAELAWIFCYTDTCSIHRSSKEHFGYWPKKRKQIYWDHEEGGQSARSK